MNSPLINAAELWAQIQNHQAPLIYDCRFDLAKPESGHDAYLMGHIPGAAYVHLDRDLSGPKNGHNGRHPLPDFSSWHQTCLRLGITHQQSIVIYDHQYGAFACRMWWMLKASGIQRVQVLNGGFESWLKAGMPTDSGTQYHPTTEQLDIAPFHGVINSAAVLANLQDRQFQILDARAPDRFMGENETLDPVGGHIPGALNRFFRNNLDSHGLFKDPQVLAEEFKALSSDLELVHQCGSGVTACHNIFAMALAGIDSAKLYAGSWSEWCSEPTRPIAKN